MRVNIEQLNFNHMPAAERIYIFSIYDNPIAKINLNNACIINYNNITKFIIDNDKLFQKGTKTKL